MTGSKLRTEDPKILGATVQNLAVLNWIRFNTLIQISYIIIFGHVTTAGGQFAESFRCTITVSFTITTINIPRLLRNDFQLGLPVKSAEWGWTCLCRISRLESMYALDLNTLPASDLGNTARSIRSLENRPRYCSSRDTSYHCYSAVCCLQNSFIFSWDDNRQWNRTRNKLRIWQYDVSMQKMNQHSPFLCCVKRLVVWSRGSQVF